MERRDVLKAPALNRHAGSRERLGILSHTVIDMGDVPGDVAIA